MNHEEKAIRAFISKNLPEAEENIVRALLAGITLEAGNSNENQETRTVKIKEDTDGKITAESIKLYNLMKVSYHDLIGVLLSQASIFFIPETKVKVIFALLQFLHEFYPQLKYKFNDQDAKILLAIYQLGTNSFIGEDVAGAYQQLFGEALASSQISRSLSYLTELKVLKYIGNGQFEPREKMTYERN